MLKNKSHHYLANREWFMREVLSSIQANPILAQLRRFFIPTICTGKLTKHIERRSTGMIKVKTAVAKTQRFTSMPGTDFLIKICQIIYI